MDVLYAVNTKKVELAATKSPRSTAKPLSVTNSDISIAQLLDFVNKYFHDILTESMLKHYQNELFEVLLYLNEDKKEPESGFKPVGYKSL